MSLNDCKKPWLKLRLENLCIDNSLDYRGQNVLSSCNLVGEIDGSFYKGNTPILVDLNYHRIGNSVNVLVKTFNISHQDQNSSGDLFIVVPGLGDNYKPEEELNTTCVLVGNSKSCVISRVKIHSNGDIQLFNGNNVNFFNNVSGIGVVENFTISYVC